MEKLSWTLTLEEQWGIWSRVFPKKTRELPNKPLAETPGVPKVIIPNPIAIASDYYTATRRMFRMLNERYGTTMGFVDHHCVATGQEHDMSFMERHITPERLRLRPRTIRVHRLLGIGQRGPYINWWWKFGICYGEERAGLIPEVRSKMAANEFGLGPYEAACMFFLVPKCLSEFESNLVAVGCDYSTEGENDVFDEPKNEIGYFRHSLDFGGYHNSIGNHGHYFGWGTSTRVLTGYIARDLSKYEA